MHQRILNQQLTQINQQLRIELEQYGATQTTTAQALAEREKQLTAKLAKSMKDAASQDAMYRQILATAERERLSAREDLATLKAEHEQLAKEFEALWQGDLRVRVYSLLRQGRFREAAAILRATADSKPAYKDWFDPMTIRIDRMEKVYQGLTASGTRFQGLVLPEGRITRIGDGKISIQDSGNSFLSLPWQSLPLDSLYLIAQKVDSETDGNELKAEIAILSGRLGEARKLLPESEEMKRICDAICRFSVEQVRMLLEVDRKKATAKAGFLMREFAGIPEFTDRYESELRNLFSPVETSTPAP
jgi:hypothetical protein